MKKSITTTLEDSKKMGSNTDWSSLDALTDQQIERSIKEDKESVPELTQAWYRQAHWTNETKEYVPVYLDHSVAEFLKRRGANYHFWINEMLRDFMRLTTGMDKRH